MYFIYKIIISKFRAKRSSFFILIKNLVIKIILKFQRLSNIVYDFFCPYQRVLAKRN